MQEQYTSHYICTTDSLGEYFRVQLEQQREPKLHTDTRWYLGAMLDRFSRTSHAFTSEPGDRGLRPLASFYDEAISTQNPTERNLILRHLGDLSLFLGAFFPGYFEKRGLKDTYVIGMGSAAYGYLAEVEQPQRAIFEELSNGFAEILQLIASLITQRVHYTAHEILGLYQRWLEQGNEEDQRELQKLGLFRDLSSPLN